ncbi:MAG TPA: hypothetical protein VGR09_15050, partial [Gemmatimonadales bacterium]|nr:hypothetical protein [Gemmatimonadales bacterium]
MTRDSRLPSTSSHDPAPVAYSPPSQDFQLTDTSDRADHIIGTTTLVPPTSRGRLRQVLGVSFGVAVLI